MTSKKVYKSISTNDIKEFNDILAVVSAREDVSGVSFNGNITKDDVNGSESRFNISWDEPESF